MAEDPNFVLPEDSLRYTLINDEDEEIIHEFNDMVNANVIKSVNQFGSEDINHLHEKLQFPMKTIGGGVDIKEARRLLVAFIQDHPILRTNNGRKLMQMLDHYFNLPKNAQLLVKNEQQIPNWQLPYQRLKPITEVDGNEEEHPIGLIKETERHTQNLDEEEEEEENEEETEEEMQPEKKKWFLRKFDPEKYKKNFKNNFKMYKKRCFFRFLVICSELDKIFVHNSENIDERIILMQIQNQAKQFLLFFDKDGRFCYLEDLHTKTNPCNRSRGLIRHVQDLLVSKTISDQDYEHIISILQLCLEKGDQYCKTRDSQIQIELKKIQIQLNDMIVQMKKMDDNETLGIGMNGEEEEIDPFRKLLWLLKTYQNRYQPVFHRALQSDPNLPQNLAIELEGILINVFEQFGDIETAEEEENVLEEIPIPEEPKPPMKEEGRNVEKPKPPMNNPNMIQKYCYLEELRKKMNGLPLFIKQIQDLIVFQKISNQDYEKIVPLLEQYSKLSHQTCKNFLIKMKREKVQKQITDIINQVNKKEENVPIMKKIISFKKTHEKPKEEQKEEKPEKEEPKEEQKEEKPAKEEPKIAENHDDEPPRMKEDVLEDKEEINPFRKFLWLLKSYKKCYQPLFHRAIQLDPNLPQDLAKEFEDIIFNVCEQFGDIDTAEEEENVLEEIEIPEKPKPPMKNPNMDPESYQRYCDLEDLRQRTEKSSSRFYIKQVQNLLVFQKISNQDYENILSLLQRFSEISHFDDDDTGFNIERTKIQKQITDWINQMRKKDFLKHMDYDETAGIVVYGEEEDFNEEEEPIHPTYETDTHRVYEHKEGNRKLIISVDKKHDQPKGFIGLMKNLNQDFKLKGGAPPKKKPQPKEEKEEKPEKEEPKIAENSLARNHANAKIAENSLARNHANAKIAENSLVQNRPNAKIAENHDDEPPKIEETPKQKPQFKLVYHEKAGDFMVGDYHGIQILIRESDGYVNATALCGHFGHDFSKFKTTNSAFNAYYQTFIEEYGDPAKIRGHENSQKEPFISIVHAGISKKHQFLRGQYVDPRLVNYIACWASPKHAIYVGKIMDELNEQKQLTGMDNQQLLSKLHAETEKQKQQLVERDQLIEEQQKQLAEKDEAYQAYKQQMEEKFQKEYDEIQKQLDEQEQIIAEQEQQLGEKDKVIARKDKFIERKQKQLAEKHQVIEEQKQQLAEKDQDIERMNRDLIDYDEWSMDVTEHPNQVLEKKGSFYLYIHRTQTDKGDVYRISLSNQTQKYENRFIKYLFINNTPDKVNDKDAAQNMKLQFKDMTKSVTYEFSSTDLPKIENKMKELGGVRQDNSVLHQVLKLKGGGGSLPPNLQPKFDSDGNKIEENHHEEEEGKKEQKIAENHDDEPPKSKEYSLEPSKSSPIVNTKYFNKFKLDYLLKQIDDGYQKQMREKSYLHQTFTKEQYEKMISDRELMFNHPTEEDIEDVIKDINTPPPKEEVSRAGLYREVYIPSEVYEKMISKEKIKTPPDKKEESVPLCRMGYPIGSPEYESYKAEMIAQMNHARNNQLQREIFYIKEDMKLAEDYWERRNRCISRYPESNEMIIHHLTEDIREEISHDRQEVIDDIFEKMDERLNQICPQEEDSKKKEEKKTSYYNKKDFQKMIQLIMTFYQNMENNLILVIKDIVSKNSTNEYYYIQDRIFGSFYCLCFHVTAAIEEFIETKITLLINITTPMSDLNLIKAYASSCLDILTQQIIQELPEYMNNLYQDLYRESFNSLGREFREHGFHLMKPIPYEEESNMLLNESNEFQTKGPIIEEVDDEPKSQMMKYEPKSPIAPKPIISQLNEDSFKAFLATLPDEEIEVNDLVHRYNEYFHQSANVIGFGNINIGDKPIRKYFTHRETKRSGKFIKLYKKL